MEASISASLPPPAWQIATQVLQPKTRTFLKFFIISHISSKGFCLPTIISLYSLLILLRLHTASHIGEGPSLRILSVNSVQISAHFGPIAAERLYISRRAGSIPTVNSNFFAYLILLAAYVLPSR